MCRYVCQRLGSSNPKSILPARKCSPVLVQCHIFIFTSGLHFVANLFEILNPYTMPFGQPLLRQPFRDRRPAHVAFRRRARTERCVRCRYKKENIATSLLLMVGIGKVEKLFSSTGAHEYMTNTSPPKARVYQLAYVHCMYIMQLCTEARVAHNLPFFEK